MSKSIKDVNTKYICPQKAAHKFRSARKLRTPLYLYGVTGVGKTALIQNSLHQKQYLYYSAEKTDADQIQVKERATEQIVVIDDLQGVTDTDSREAYYDKIQELLKMEQVWLILIARCPFPRWLLPLRTKYIFAEIEEDDFLFSLEEQKRYVEQYDLHLSDELQEEAWNLGRGNPLSLLFFAMEKGDLEQTQKREWDYIETHIYDQWSAELQDFFMSVSVVETFTVGMAAMLTGRNDVEKLIFQAEELGNFFDIRGNGGIWKCRWEMRKSMQQRLRRKRTTEQINRLYYTAGLYYELEDRIPEALFMYEQYHDMESISRLLVSNTRKDPSNGHYYELRKYYLELPEQMIENNPALMAGMSLLHSILMNEEESERWYGKLEAYLASATGGARKEAMSRLVDLQLTLPHRDTENMEEILNRAEKLIRERKIELPEISVTGNMPSVLNGEKDFCNWVKADRNLAIEPGQKFEFVLGKSGKGLLSIAMAECYLEKGEDIFKIFSYAEKGKMEADSVGRLELVFVGLGILAWMSILKKDAESAESVLMSFRERAQKENPNLLPNIDAFLCRVHLYEVKDISDWLEKAPDEHKEFCMMDRFQYLTKVRVYLQMEKYGAAYGLLQQILFYAEKMNRNYISMEAKLLLAIVQYRMGQEAWKETLQTCISQAETYHFVRIFSREGSILYPLMKSETFVWKDKEYQRQVCDECFQMWKAYPAYLTDDQEAKISLSENALQILKMQSEGLSAADIAEKLKLSEATVKYHCRETYRKLGVKNKAAAITEAKKRKLI